MSARLPRSQSTSNCQLRCTPFSPAAVFQLVCNQLARLQSVSCTVSPPLQLCLHYVSPAAVCQLSCICQLSYDVQASLQSVISAANNLLTHDMSAWLQSVQSVSSGECQLGCTHATPLQASASNLLAWLQSLSIVKHCRLYCNISALQFASPAAVFSKFA